MHGPTRLLPAVGESEFVIQFHDHGEPDEFARRGFFAYWLTDTVGRACHEQGVRGQVLFADPAHVARGAHQRGATVRYLND